MSPRSRLTFATPTQTELAAQAGQGDFMASLLSYARDGLTTIVASP
jgi:hypothetical protein